MAPRAEQSCNVVLLNLTLLYLTMIYCTHPLHEMDNVIHGLLAGQELIDVCDNVDADVAEEILGLVVGGLGQTEEEEEREDLEHDEAWTS